MDTVARGLMEYRVGDPVIVHGRHLAAGDELLHFKTTLSAGTVLSNEGGTVVVRLPNGGTQAITWRGTAWNKFKAVGNRALLLRATAGRGRS